MRRSHVIAAAWMLAGLTGAAQTPQPFPRPGTPATSAPATTQAGKPPAVAPPTTPGPNDVPTEGSLGVTIYPGAEFLQSFDATRGQRYYLYGTNASLNEVVTYYRTLLRQKGELVYDEPAIHQFDIGKFKEESMAFPPSVTVKDYSCCGSPGYLNPKRGKQPTRFKTIIQIVPATGS